MLGNTKTLGFTDTRLYLMQYNNSQFLDIWIELLFVIVSYAPTWKRR
jgi:hypothetical protein